jgi:hypothetical protein
MTIFKKLALAAALVVGTVTGAHAATVSTTFDLSNSTAGVGGVYTGTYAIDSFKDPFGDPLPALKKGDLFEDFFQLTIQDSQYVTFDATSTFKPKATVTFTDVGLYDFAGGFYAPADSSNSRTSLYEDGIALHSGSYFLYIAGIVNKDGGGFTGTLTTSPVPEPSSLALLLAGVGAMFSLARRRKSHQA